MSELDFQRNIKQFIKERLSTIILVLCMLLVTLVFILFARNYLNNQLEALRVQEIITQADAFMVRGEQAILENRYLEAIMEFMSAQNLFVSVDDENGVESAEIHIEKARQYREAERIMLAERTEILRQEQLAIREEARRQEALRVMREQLEADRRLAYELLQQQALIEQERLMQAEANEAHLQFLAAFIASYEAQAAKKLEASIIRSANYEHNRAIEFDLETLINNQNRYPASQVLMGSVEGMNEGWYNGCGWVAVYNAMILLGDPHHPATIVDNFERYGGTVLDGVFGTFPHHLERYFREHGFVTNHHLFPMRALDIDDAIRDADIAIVAFLHHRAAHYFMVQYNQETGTFLVLNDSFADRRSHALELASSAYIGSSIDSVAALMRETPEIIFAFSLITVNHP